MSKHGWLSPFGKFVPCDYLGHERLADKLGTPSHTLEKLGWLKLSSGTFLFGDYGRDRECTQAQLTKMYEVAEALGEDADYLSLCDVR